MNRETATIIENKLAVKFHGVMELRPINVSKKKKAQVITTFTVAELNSKPFAVAVAKFNGVPVRFIYDLDGNHYTF